MYVTEELRTYHDQITGVTNRNTMVLRLRNVKFFVSYRNIEILNVIMIKITVFDTDNSFYYDNSKFLDTTVHYTKDPDALVYRASSGVMN